MMNTVPERSGGVKGQAQAVPRVFGGSRRFISILRPEMLTISQMWPEMVVSRVENRSARGLKKLGRIEKLFYKAVYN